MLQYFKFKGYTINIWKDTHQEKKYFIQPLVFFLPNQTGCYRHSSGEISLTLKFLMWERALLNEALDQLRDALGDRSVQPYYLHRLPIEQVRLRWVDGNSICPECQTSPTFTPFNSGSDVLSMKLSVMNSTACSILTSKIIHQSGDELFNLL